MFVAVLRSYIAAMLVIPATGEGQSRGAAGERRCRVLAVGSQLLELRALEQLLEAPPLKAAVVLALQTDTALDAIRAGSVDVVVCDLDAEPLAGPAFAATVASSQGPPVLLLADAHQAERLVDALRCGARGFLTKECPVDEFIGAVIGLQESRIVVSDRLLDAVVDRLAASPAKARSGVRRRTRDFRPA